MTPHLPRARFRRLRLALVAALLLGAGAARAVDTPPSDALPDLAPMRALVYSGEYEKAALALEKLAGEVRHADIFNLLGFSLRSIGRYAEADKWYREALYYNPEHRQAIEYQGELFIATGQLDKAKENIFTLKIFCPNGCPELDKLEKAYSEAAAKQPAR